MAFGRRSRKRIPGLTRDILFLLAAGMTGVGLAAIASSDSGLPARPPQAELAVVDGAASGTWQAISPLHSSWRSSSDTNGVADATAAFPSRPVASWSRVAVEHATGKTVLFLLIPRRPDLIVLLRYRRLTSAGVPDGSPQRLQCGMATRCTQSKCTRHNVPGMCVVIDDLKYGDGTAVVVIARWHGRMSQYASWGFVV